MKVYIHFHIFNPKLTQSIKYFCKFKGITNSEVGLIIASTLSLAYEVQWGVRQSAEVENQMTSVERVIEYGQLPPEESSEKRAPAAWPQEGRIQFDHMSLSYNDNHAVLKNICCSIKAKEKAY